MAAYNLVLSAAKYEDGLARRMGGAKRYPSSCGENERWVSQGLNPFYRASHCSRNTELCGEAGPGFRRRSIRATIERIVAIRR